MSGGNTKEYDRDAYHIRKDVWQKFGSWYCRDKVSGEVLGPFTTRQVARDVRRTT